MGISAAVVGIGNLLLTDEGVGVHAVNTLRERYSFPSGVSLIDGGTMGLDLLPFIEGNDALLIIDAVDFHAEPGTLKALEGADIKMFLDLKFSVHQIGVPDMLFAADLKGILPKKLCLVGIQPLSLEVGSVLSPVVQARYEELIDVIIRKLAEWGIEARGLSPSEAPAATREYGSVSGHTV